VVASDDGELLLTEVFKVVQRDWQRLQHTCPLGAVVVSYRTSPGKDRALRRPT
jgi:hypothetical protein